MSILGRTVPLKALAAIALLMVCLVGVPALTQTPAREVRLVARGMSFYLKDDRRTPNPLIEIKAGERVRVVLENQERGVTHDFAVPAFGASLDPLRWNESGDVIIDAPDAPGTYEYICRPHQLMMRGIIRVY